MSADTTTVDVEHVAQRSEELLNQRVEAVRELAHAHNERAAAEAEAKRRRDELEAELKETADLLEDINREKYDAALKAGWTERDLRGLKLALPAKKTPQRRRRRTAPAAKQQAAEIAPTASSDPAQVAHNTHG